MSKIVFLFQFVLASLITIAAGASIALTLFIVSENINDKILFPSDQLRITDNNTDSLDFLMLTKSIPPIAKEALPPQVEEEEDDSGCT